MIDRRPIKDAHPLRSFVFDNIARVGDAVHAMAPHPTRRLRVPRGWADARRGLTAAPTVAEGLAHYDDTRRRTSQNAVRGSRLMSRLSNEQRHPWLRDTFVTGIGRLLSTREASQRPACIR